MVSNTVSNMVLKTVLKMVLNMVLNTDLNMVLNTVLNMSSSLNGSRISIKEDTSFSYYNTSFFKARLYFILRSSFIRVDVSNSNKITEYSSFEMESSDNAFEMRLLILLSDETATIAIFSCLSIFNDIF